MKTLLFTSALLFCLVQGGVAQDSLKKRSIGIEVAYVNPGIFKDGFFPALTYTKGKHLFFAGPQFLTPKTSKKMFPGAQVGYRIYPNGNGQRFNLFFDYSLSFVKGVEDNKYLPGYSWSYNPPNSRTLKQLSLDNYFGFGFQLKILEQFYLNSGVSVGVGFYKEEYTYYYNDGRIASGKGPVRLRSVNPVNTQFKIGLGYKFNLKQK